MKSKEQLLERRRKYDAAHRPIINARKARWRARHGNVAAAHSKKWRSGNSEKVKAQLLLKTETRAGRITRLEYCERCYKGGILHGHHDDYSKPLDVQWLCPKCHKAEHFAVAEISRVKEGETTTTQKGDKQKSDIIR